MGGKSFRGTKTRMNEKDEQKRVKTSIEYEAFLQSPEWKKIRTQRLNKDHHRCVVCGSKELLQVHHLNYRLITDVDMLVTLCKACHQRWHRDIMPTLTDDIEKLNTAFTLKLDEQMAEYAQNRDKIFVEKLSELIGENRIADSGRVARIFRHAEIPCSTVKIAIYSVYNSVMMAMTGKKDSGGGKLNHVTWN